jgi:L-fucose mutarotase/ribose pyranase (RbsD/FucU family)
MPKYVSPLLSPDVCEVVPTTLERMASYGRAATALARLQTGECCRCGHIILRKAVSDRT